MLQKLWLIFAALIVLPSLALSQETPDGEAAEAVEEEVAAAPKKKGRSKGDPLKARLAEVSKVHKNQMTFGTKEGEAWKTFWTKLRDERGLFEVRLSKQREGFVDSLRSLDSKDHGQALLDFETMQTNVMKSFEDNQSNKIKEFVSERESRLREFGGAQEAERERLAAASTDAWLMERASLKIEMPVSPGKKDSKSKKKS